ncbi:hypothetical protein [Phaeodactylibacter sp.]|jgi:hypothetical protein|uniref:hypothetical protein n=1 Tax=Phaeodactylibacter sp. TaxID=1940289 RepID=UPI0025E1A53D|nr:hypothetical protein [Phaeodactylibacter sp.]MCI4649731.1 hypothetical protein [Phaeodactylibacter sp.]MCI5093022.1 hypothetical protein [Phaeodactylibacter sp.]
MKTEMRKPFKSNGKYAYQSPRPKEQVAGLLKEMGLSTLFLLTNLKKLQFTALCFMALAASTLVSCNDVLDSEGGDEVLLPGTTEVSIEDYQDIEETVLAFEKVAEVVKGIQQSQFPENWGGYSAIDSIMAPPELPLVTSFSQASPSSVAVPDILLASVIEYVQSFEPIVNALEDAIDNREIGGLLSAIAVFEIELGIDFTDIENGETIQFRGRSTYCCCCLDQDVPAGFGFVNCGQFRARKIWAKIRCKFIYKIQDKILNISCGGRDLFKKGNLSLCESKYTDPIGSSTSPLTSSGITSGLYNGSSQGLYYVRFVENKVFWFGESGDGGWANVMKGVVDNEDPTGFYITADFYDLPKGEATDLGPLVLKISKDGNLITKVSGSGINASYTRTSMPAVLPNAQPAGFSQTGNINDLDGIWNGNDGAKYYIREIDGKVAWFGEENFNSGQPGFANVAVGVRQGNYVLLEWADVPKGSSTGHGKLILKIDSADRMSKISGLGFGGTSFVRQ